MKQRKVRRLASPGARKERAGCPEWAIDATAEFAASQAAYIRNALVTNLDATAYTVASVGANLLALALVAYHGETCCDPNCESCKTRCSVDAPKLAHDVLSFYLNRVALDLTPAQGRA